MVVPEPHLAFAHRPLSAIKPTFATLLPVYLGRRRFARLRARNLQKRMWQEQAENDGGRGRRIVAAQLLFYPLLDVRAFATMATLRLRAILKLL